MNEATAETKTGWILRVLRKLLTPVQPWDFGEAPERHWWDVYAQ
ncbi:MAG TPA: hypothetical protein VEM13_12540 [Gemmatimonadales bacterium]|nr:hypothetical protein [Gemmatimonadales bacterium]